MSFQNKTTQQCKTNFLFKFDLVSSPSSSLDGDFVHDDVEAVLRNPDVTSAYAAASGAAGDGTILGGGGRPPRGVAEVFANDFWGSPMASNRSHKSYRPLTTLLFR